MKYQKPLMREIGQVSLAEGACASGIFVGTCTNLAGGQAGECLANGTGAATCSTSGSTVSSTCTAGTLGRSVSCATGDFATP